MEGQREDENWCMAAGMVSSGKSRFLNSIFPRLALPVGSISLTAAPTYIRHGKNAARIITDKGETIERRPDGLAGYDSRWVRRQSGIREVEVYLEEDLLKEHLVLIDMPGIGGVKEEADRSFYQLLPETQVVFYFLEKAMTQGDKKYLDEICHQGAKLIVVRTKIDTIFSSEESVEEVLREEEQHIRGLYPECGLYFISLDRELKENQLEQLKAYMLSSLAEDAGRVKKERQRLSQLKELEEKQKRLLEDAQRAKTGEIQLRGLEKSRERRRRELEEQLRLAETDVEKAADAAKQNCMLQGRAYLREKFPGENWTREDEIQLIEQALANLDIWYQRHLLELARKYLPGTDADFFGETDYQFTHDKLPLPLTGQEQRYEKLAAEYFQRAKTDLLKHFQKARRSFQNRFYDGLDAEKSLIRQILRMDRKITGERLKRELAGTEKRLEALRDGADG